MYVMDLVKLILLFRDCFDLIFLHLIDEIVLQCVIFLPERSIDFKIFSFSFASK